MAERIPPQFGPVSAYRVILSNLDEDGRLIEPELELPDEAAVWGDGPAWAPGAWDGVLGHHLHGAGGSADPQEIERMVDACAEALADPTQRRLQQLVTAVCVDNVLGTLDPFIRVLRERRWGSSGLHALGAWLATSAVDRRAVKVGVALLGVTGLGDDLDIIRTLGAHDEFTLYAAVAVVNGLDPYEDELWAMARKVDGWGRIECVERLAATSDPQIRSWILRHGYRNTVMNEYLAYVAATSGDLLAELRTPDPDRRLLTAAGDIIRALVAGGPAEAMEHYPDGAAVATAYLEHLDDRAETLADFLAVAALDTFATGTRTPQEFDRLGWTEDLRRRVHAQARAILGRHEWASRIAVGLESTDPAERGRAREAAEILGSGAPAGRPAEDGERG